MGMPLLSHSWTSRVVLSPGLGEENLGSMSGYICREGHEVRLSGATRE